MLPPEVHSIACNLIALYETFIRRDATASVVPDLLAAEEQVSQFVREIGPGDLVAPRPGGGRRPGRGRVGGKGRGQTGPPSPGRGDGGRSRADRLARRALSAAPPGTATAASCAARASRASRTVFMGWWPNAVRRDRGCFWRDCESRRRSAGRRPCALQWRRRPAGGETSGVERPAPAASGSGSAT